jgi:membrane protein implicated in regulation of membrane protease activity
MKRMLTGLHIALIITVVLLLVLTFVSSFNMPNLIGAVINVNALQTYIPVNNLVLGVATFLAGLTIVILAMVLHYAKTNKLNLNKYKNSRGKWKR